VNNTYIIVQILAEFRWTPLGGAAGFRVQTHTSFLALFTLYRSGT
jgi:hypothetical protein